MTEHGDKHRHRRSDQTDQSLRDKGQSKSKEDKNQTGNWLLQQQDQREDPDNNRNRSSQQQEKIKPLRRTERNFDLIVDNVPYLVKAIAFTFNGVIRYRVSVNGNPEHVFTWDPEIRQLRAINDEASTLPDNLGKAISEKLQLKA